ncbi:MAG TPA: molybdopterin-dependent oxidoreductase [Caldilineaceae bacterium]|nr:molybdopterin-dependent oxidoreductase [Caldilineaceae bacterium]
MTIKTLGLGALLGALLTAPLIAVMYLAYQLAGLPFVPFDLFNWMTPLLPGPLITVGIDRMIDLLLLLGLDVAATAKTAEQTLAIVQFFVIGVVAGAVFYATLKARTMRADWMTGVTLGLIFGLPMVAISLSAEQSAVNPILSLVWLLILFLGWGLAFSYAYARLEAPAAATAGQEARSVEAVSRRRFVITLGATAATITVVGAGVGVLLARREQQRSEQELANTTAHQVDETTVTIFPNANDPVMPVPGTRPEYTPVKDHYKVFIGLLPTVIDGATWQLPITGLVDHPLMLTLDDLRTKYAARNQYITLSCISGNLGTTLISTTQWTGVSVQEILAEAKVHPAAKYLYITSGDGFYESIPLDLINADERIMFCYSWDGNTLPVDHGFPLRIWIPDRYGMKQPKWITGVEVTDQYKKGYWVERSWDEIAQVKTVSVIDTVAVDAIIHDGDQKRVPVGGIAWAGARGISGVEVRVDGGPWQPAQLRSPLSETTWVIWRYEWPFQVTL